MLSKEDMPLYRAFFNTGQMETRTSSSGEAPSPFHFRNSAESEIVVLQVLHQRLLPNNGLLAAKTVSRVKRYLDAGAGTHAQTYTQGSLILSHFQSSIKKKSR